MASATAAAATAAVWLLPFQHIGLWSRGGITDIPTYLRIVDAIADGGVPYRDVEIEYPPLATAVFWLAHRLPGGFETTFGLMMMLALCATAAGVVATASALALPRGRQLVAGGLVAVSPLLLGNLVETRFDPVLAAVLAWTAWAAVTARWRTMWVLVAVGILLKLVPVALIPVLAVWHAHRTHVRAALTGACAAVAGSLVAALPLVVIAPSGMWHVLDYHLRRPPQIESLAADYMLVLHALSGSGVTVENSFGSQGLSGHGPVVVAAAVTAVSVALVGAIAVATAAALRRARPGPDAGLVVAGLAATTAALLATGKVLSPQFMVWLLPTVFLVGGRYRWGATAAGIAALVTTQLYFPRRYFDLVALQDLPIALLTLRNAVLVALVALCWPRADIAAGPPAARFMSRAPGAPPVSGPDHAVRARYIVD